MRRARVLAAALFLLIFANAAYAADIVVAAPGQPGCTLANAILAANLGATVQGCTGSAGRDRIVLPVGTFTISSAHAGDSEGATGLPLITSAIVFVGSGPDTVIEHDPAVSQSFRLMRMYGVFASLEIRDLTMRGGRAGTHAGGALLLGPGHGATLTNVIFEDNQADQGGAVGDLLSWPLSGGPSAGHVTVNGGRFSGNIAQRGGAIAVSPGGSLTVNRPRLSDNEATEFSDNRATEGGAIHAPGGGAAHAVRVAVSHSTFAGNSASFAGGAVLSSYLDLTDTLFDGNTASSRGGAVYTDTELKIQTTRFTGNQAQAGGAVNAVGLLTVRGSTFDVNMATEQDGGALGMDARVEGSLIVNTTFSGNQADARGGAIVLVHGTLALNNVTIVGNRGGVGPGIAVGLDDAAELLAANSIVAENLTTGGAAADVAMGSAARLTSLGHNLIGSDAGTMDAFTLPGDQTGTAAAPRAPGLLPLADNGGPTPTHALDGGSDALDKGFPGDPGIGDGACEARDQRGEPRPGPGGESPLRCDVGAFEQRLTYPLTLTVPSGGLVEIVGRTATCVGEATCDIPLTAESTFTLRAVPAMSMRFNGWTGACVPAEPVNVPEECDVTIDGPVTVGAAFIEDKIGTQISASASPGSPKYGVPVQLTAIVTSAGSGTPSGTVRFFDGGMLLGEAMLGGDRAVWTTAGTELLPGDHTIEARYSGDQSFFASANTTLVTVLNADTTVLLSSNPNPSLRTQSVRFTVALVSNPPAAGAPNGRVNVYAAANQSIPLFWIEVVNGAGWTSYASLPVGTHTLRAVFVGDATHGESSGTATHVVERARTTTTVDPTSPNPSRLGGPISLTARVLPQAPVTAPPTNTTVTFKLPGGDVRATMTNGVATLPAVTSLPYGVHLIQAVYDGSPNFEGSAGSTMHTVGVPLTISQTAGGAVLRDTATQCPGSTSCVVWADLGAVVTLRAQATQGTFIRWSGDCVVTGALREICTVTMNGARSVSAVFGFSLTVTRAGDERGTVTFSTNHSLLPDTCTTNPCSRLYAAGTSVLITPVAPLGGTFSYWGNKSCPTAPTCTVIMNSAFSTSAVFASPQATPVARITYRNGSAVTEFVSTQFTGSVTLPLSGASSSDPEHGALTYTWTTGSQTGTGVYFTPALGLGRHSISLQVRDIDGLTHTTSVTVVVFR